MDEEEAARGAAWVEAGEEDEEAAPARDAAEAPAWGAAEAAMDGSSSTASGSRGGGSSAGQRRPRRWSARGTRRKARCIWHA